MQNEFLNQEATKIANLFQTKQNNGKSFSVATVLIIIESLVTLAKACGYLKIAQAAANPTRLQRLILRSHVFAATLKHRRWRTEDVGGLVEAILERGKTVTQEELSLLQSAALTYNPK